MSARNSADVPALNPDTMYYHAHTAVLGGLQQEESMQPYGNYGGNSGVAAYEIGPDFIRIRFISGPIYLYTYASCGQHNCERMKSLAADGQGLQTFINTVVRRGYSRRER